MTRRRPQAPDGPPGPQGRVTQKPVRCASEATSIIASGDPRASLKVAPEHFILLPNTRTVVATPRRCAPARKSLELIDSSVALGVPPGLSFPSTQVDHRTLKNNYVGLKSRDSARGPRSPRNSSRFSPGLLGPGSNLPTSETTRLFKKEYCERLEDRPSYYSFTGTR